MLKLRQFAYNVNPVELYLRLKDHEETHPPHKSHILHLFSKIVLQNDSWALLLSFKVVLHYADGL